MDKRTLLYNISDESIRNMIPCFKPVRNKYSAGETILTYSDDEIKDVAVLQKGSARLELFNSEGTVALVENYYEGDIFGCIFSLPLDAFEYVVTAETDCSVLFVDYNHIITPCSNVCPHHSQLISNLFIMAAQRSQELSLHISILGQPSIRSKLITYLKCIRSAEIKKRGRAASANVNSIVFTIPTSLSQLAEYLRVDRSAMMREIKAMKADGLLDSERRDFRLMT